MPKNFKIINGSWLPVMILLVVLGTTTFGILWLSAHPAGVEPKTERDNPYYKNDGSWPDLDNCPAGPGGTKCYNEFGIEISCKDTDQADWNFNLQGDICDPCGNGRIDSGEDCDSENLGGLNCINLGLTGGTLACSPQCKFDTSSCFYCGDNNVNIGEQCDLDNLAGKTCGSINFAWSDSGVCSNQPEKKCNPGQPSTWQAVCGSAGSCLGGLVCSDNQASSCQFDTCNCCGDSCVGSAEYCDGNSSFPASAATKISTLKGDINFRSFMIADECLVCGSSNQSVDQRCQPENYLNCAKVPDDNPFLVSPTKYLWIPNGIGTITQMVALLNEVKVKDVWGETHGGVCSRNNAACNIDNSSARPAGCGECLQILDNNGETGQYDAATYNSRLTYDIGTIVHEYVLCFDNADPGILSVKDLARGENCTYPDETIVNNPGPVAVNVNDGEAWVAYRERTLGATFCSDNSKACTLLNLSSCANPATATCNNNHCSDNDAYCTSLYLSNCANPATATCNPEVPSLKLANVWKVAHFSESVLPGKANGLIKVCEVDGLGPFGGGVVIDKTGDAWVAGGSQHISGFDLCSDNGELCLNSDKSRCGSPAASCPDSSTSKSVALRKFKGGNNSDDPNKCQPIKTIADAMNGTVSVTATYGTIGMAITPNGGIWFTEHGGGARYPKEWNPNNPRTPERPADAAVINDQVRGRYTLNNLGYIPDPDAVSPKIIFSNPVSILFGTVTDQFGTVFVGSHNDCDVYAGFTVGNWCDKSDGYKVEVNLDRLSFWKSRIPSPSATKLTMELLSGVPTAYKRHGLGIDIENNVWASRSGSQECKLSTEYEPNPDPYPAKFDCRAGQIPGLISETGAMEKITQDVMETEITGDSLPDVNAVSGDSNGFVWGVNSGKVGDQVCRFGLSGQGERCFTSSVLTPYGYPYIWGDFLGMSRAMVFKTKAFYYPALRNATGQTQNPFEAFDLDGDLTQIKDSWEHKWGKVLYQSLVPTNTSINVYVCFGDNVEEVGDDCAAQANVDFNNWEHSGNWILAGNGNGTGAAKTYNNDYSNDIFKKKYLRLRVVLESTTAEINPTIWDLKVGCTNSDGVFKCQ